MTLIDEIKLLLEAPTMNARDIRTMLRQDHDEAIKLARDMYESESGDERRALLRQLKPALVVHSRAEEKEVYDVLLKFAEPELRDMAWEGYVEHGVLDDLLEKLLKSRKTETDEWKAHAKVLLEFLEHHMEDENERMLPALEEHFNDDEREALGRRFTAAKSRLTMKLRAA
ncbi:MAG TPA: hemerythrin domain-containing protein [Casimicrobiaceae bacterium]|nr:hemerythrin domain-containing protein [Casimicrobiaceae bacterium]